MLCESYSGCHVDQTVLVIPASVFLKSCLVLCRSLCTKFEGNSLKIGNCTITLFNSLANLQMYSQYIFTVASSLIDSLIVFVANQNASMCLQLLTKLFIRYLLLDELPFCTGTSLLSNQNTEFCWWIISCTVLFLWLFHEIHTLQRHAFFLNENVLLYNWLHILCPKLHSEGGVSGGWYLKLTVEHYSNQHLVMSISWTLPLFTQNYLYVILSEYCLVAYFLTPILGQCVFFVVFVVW